MRSYKNLRFYLILSLIFHLVLIARYFRPSPHVGRFETSVAVSYLPQMLAVNADHPAKPVRRREVAAVPDLDPGPSKIDEARLREDLKPEAVESEQQAISNYLNLIVQMIDREKRYPLEAQRRGRQGRVTLNVVINRNGELKSVEVLEPSAYSELDSAAVDTIRRMKSCPPLPAEFSQGEIQLKIPVEYRLQ